ncbi:MAG: hypothetical protein CGW95_04390 [Phenylobacterium zucineum]|nr:MAG: hypothetical protein CGW95_04390 [Phenylobacterium zucineum]
MTGAASLALAGCSKPKTTDNAAVHNTSQARNVSPAPTPPKRRPGLWEQTVVGSGTTQVSHLCLDETAEAKLTIWGTQTGKTTCAEQAVSPTADGWAFHSRCDLGGSGTVVSKGTIRGDVTHSYTVEMQSTTLDAGAAHMNGDRKISIQAQWQGPCPPGMAPGEMALPDGVKINMLKL